MALLDDIHIGQAISNVRRRAERQDDLDKLRNSFVDVGILQQLTNNDNQIIYGRRGTGKTHVLKVLASQASGPNSSVCYIDFRTLGSTAQFTDDSLNIRIRCTCLFRDILVYIHDALLEHFVGSSSTLSEEAGTLLDEFADAAISEVRTYGASTVSLKEGQHNESKDQIELSLSPSPKVSLGSDDHHTDELEKTTTTQISRDDKVVFPGINTLLANLLRAQRVRLVLLLDEWSSLPWEIQPFLAEFLKRAFFANPSITIKIASLEQRSNFGEKRLHTRLGFEVGSDIAASLDIDDYYVFVKDPDNVTAVFADILFKHINNELPDGYLLARYGVHRGLDFADSLFKSRDAFYELVRASEGVARDLINICSTCYFATLRKRKDKIDIGDIREAARKWYEQDKSPNLDGGMRRLLDRITALMVSRRTLYVFCLPIELEKHPAIQRLVDARVVHLVHRGTSDDDSPGVRYSLLSLDYGSYVHLLGTAKQPELGFRMGGDFSRGRYIKKFLIPMDFLDSD